MASRSLTVLSPDLMIEIVFRDNTPVEMLENIGDCQAGDVDFGLYFQQLDNSSE
jgi:hypothetical protein